MATTFEPETRRESAAKAAPPAAPASSPAEPRPGGRRGTVFMIMGVVLLALVALGARGWIYGLSHVSTDNGQVDGHIVPTLPKVGGFGTEGRSARLPRPGRRPSRGPAAGGAPCS